MDIKNTTLHELSAALNAKEVSSVELCKSYLAEIDQRDAEIGAFTRK